MIRKAKSIEQLYEEVKSSDLVITVDAPLRTALNKRLNKPMLGVFAVTPKELASKYAVQNLHKSLLDEPKVVLETARKLDMDVKQAHYCVRKTFDIWQKTGKVEAVEPHLTDGEKTVLDVIKTLPTVYLALEKFDQSALENKKVAVIGLNFFTKLDENVLPEEYAQVEVFTSEEYELPKLYTFINEKDVVDRVVSMINRENADDIAIALNLESSYLPLVKSRLANRGIPLNMRGQLKEHFLTRSLLGLIETGMNLNNRTVKEIAPFIAALSLKLDPKYNNYLLSEYMDSINKDSSLNEFYDFLKNLTKQTYGEVLDWMKNRDIELPIEFVEVLQQLDIQDQIIDSESYSNLAYYMENFDIDIPGGRRGVLLVNCKKAAYIHKPVCFFLGMDVSWTRDVNEEWPDEENEGVKSLDMFQILLQQGQRRYYFVSTMKDNQEVIPCYYFNVLLKPTIESFHDPLFTNMEVWSVEEAAERKGSKCDIETESGPFTHFSQNSLNLFALCPKKYAHEQLTYTEEEEYFLKGNLLHDFAAFYFNHPDIVETKSNDFFVDEMVKEYKQIAGDMKIEVERSFFRIGVQNIRAFIDALDIDENIAIDGMSASKKSAENRFAQLLKVPIDKKNSEPSFEDDDLSIKGIIDLVVNLSTIVDYKSGINKKLAAGIVREANLALIEDKVDFQPLLYILELKKFNAGIIDFHYHYCLGNYKDVINGMANNDDNVIPVKYYPLTFNEFLQTEEAVYSLASPRDRGKIVNSLGVESFTDFFQQNPIAEELQFDAQQLLESEYRSVFSEYIFDGSGKRNSTLQKSIDGFLKAIVSVRTAKRQATALFFKEDLDAFEVFVKEKIEEMNRYLEDGFPAKPLSRDVCKKCSCADICLNEI